MSFLDKKSINRTNNLYRIMCYVVIFFFFSIAYSIFWLGDTTEELLSEVKKDHYASRIEHVEWVEYNEQVYGLLVKMIGQNDRLYIYDKSPLTQRYRLVEDLELDESEKMLIFESGLFVYVLRVDIGDVINVELERDKIAQLPILVFVSLCIFSGIRWFLINHTNVSKPEKIR